MFVQGVHDARPRDDDDDDDPPTGIASGRAPVRIPTGIAPPGTSEDRTAVLTISDVMLGADPADPKTADLAPSFGLAPEPLGSASGGPHAQGTAPPSTPHAPMLEQRPAHLQTQQLDHGAFVKAQQTVRVPPSAVITASPASRNPDALAEFLDQARIRGTAAAARANLKFRAATPEQQIVIVAVGTASIAVVVVLFVWALFLR
jgi:hypothetical protein